jgi:hypothetical protein
MKPTLAHAALLSYSGTLRDPISTTRADSGTALGFLTAYLVEE